MSQTAADFRSERVFRPPTDVGAAKHVAIVGAGFCGTLLATKLLRASSSSALTVFLIDGSKEMGRGVAYARREFPYLLNVPAKRMSADRHDPSQFVRFAKRSNPAVTGDDYLPRELYGDYLQSLLRSAERQALPHRRLIRIQQSVTRLLIREDRKLGVMLESGDALFADDVVLTTGNPPSAEVPGAEQVRHHPSFVNSAWTLPANRTEWRNVLIVGTGLSMVDVASRLLSETTPQSNLRLHALSRRGLVALPQQEFRENTQLSKQFAATPPKSLREAVRAARVLAVLATETGGNWREAIAALRLLAPQLWATFSSDDRRRFLTHVRPYWEVHRHRVPPSTAQQLEHARSNGDLRILAGRILSMESMGEQIKVRWRARGKSSPEDLSVDAVVNATGPDYRLHATEDPLLKSLRDEKAITCDPFQTGLLTDSSGALIDGYGNRHEHLFYLGPMLRATYWESTAVGELLVRTERLASILMHANHQREIV